MKSTTYYYLKIGNGILQSLKIWKSIRVNWVNNNNDNFLQQRKIYLNKWW